MSLFQKMGVKFLMTDKKNRDRFEDIIAFLTRATPEIEQEVKSEIESEVKAGEVAQSQKIEDEKWKSDEREQSIRKWKLSNQEYEDEIEFRRFLTHDLLKITKAWLIFIAVIIVLEGLHNTILFWHDKNTYVYGFYLESNVMIAVLTTTTITVLGLFLVVTRHIFYRSNKDSKKD